MNASGRARAEMIYPLLTLRMGVAYHQAIVDVCRDFADNSAPP
jgi:hypothetical protein